MTFCTVSRIACSRLYRARRAGAHDLLAAAAPDQLAVLAVEQVDLEGGNLVIHGARLGHRRAAPVSSPVAAPVTAAVVGGDLVLAIVDDQVGAHRDVAPGVALGRTQAALVELLGDGFADALLGEVALDAWVVGAVFEGGLRPAPATVGGEVAGAVEVAVELGGFAGCEAEEQAEQQDSADHGFSPVRVHIQAQRRMKGKRKRGFEASPQVTLASTRPIGRDGRMK